LLDKAGDEFSNHGCNDFDLQSELKLTKEEAIAVAHKLREAMVRTECGEEADLERKDAYFYDWLLMRHFEARVKQALQEAQQGGPGEAFPVGGQNKASLETPFLQRVFQCRGMGAPSPRVWF